MRSRPEQQGWQARRQLRAITYPDLMVHRRSLNLIIWFALWGSLVVPTSALERQAGQVRGGGTLAGATTTDTTPQQPGRAVSGRVINTATGAPVPRALVRINSYGVLTDHEGRFEFANVSGDSVNILLMKPGFSVPGAAMMGGMRLVRLDKTNQAIELQLAPDALIRGAVISRAGEPLARVPVQLRRMSYNQLPGRLMTSGQTFTNAHGEFRFSVAAGDYSLEAQYVPALQGSAEAVLPVRFPEATSSDATSMIHVRSGEERTVELRPEVSRTYLVSAETAGAIGVGRITAMPSTGLPLSLFANSFQQGALQFRIPRGTYTLKVTTRQGDVDEEAVTHLVVPEHDVAGIVLNFAPLPAIPIEMEFDASATSDNSSRPQQPNVMFEPIGAEFMDQGRTYTVEQSRGKPGDTPSAPVIHLPVGTYRAVEMGWGGRWFVKSITFGGSDLLMQNLTVAHGGDGTPIRVRYSDQTAGLSGTVTADSKRAGVFLYLVPNRPIMTTALIRRTDADGKFQIPDLAPGSYDVLASEVMTDIPLNDVAVRKRLAKYIKTISIGPGEKLSLDLEPVPEAEMQP